MSSIANITVFDGAATPVTHTLNPLYVKEDKGVLEAKWRESVAGLPSEAQVSCTFKQRTLPSGVCESRVRVEVPTMESISGQNAAGYTAAPKVAFVDAEEWVSYQHPRSTITGRRLAKQILTNLSNNVSTSVAAATAGPFDELVSQQIMPT